MRDDEKNLDMVETVARQLNQIKDEKFVFVGGSVISTYVDNPSIIEVRETDDVDCVIEVYSPFDYENAKAKLLKNNFSPDSSKGAPLCRWKFCSITVDIMTSDEKFLGFTNRWYQALLDSAQEYKLKSLIILRPQAPLLIASKFEAFKSRGNNGDIRTSHDLEDILVVAGNRASLVNEIESSKDEIKEYLKENFRYIKNHRQFNDLLSIYKDYRSHLVKFFDHF